jgi:hypothetical protein
MRDAIPDKRDVIKNSPFPLRGAGVLWDAHVPDRAPVRYKLRRVCLNYRMGN